VSKVEGVWITHSLCPQRINWVSLTTAKPTFRLPQVIWRSYNNFSDKALHFWARTHTT